MTIDTTNSGGNQVERPLDEPIIEDVSELLDPSPTTVATEDSTAPATATPEATLNPELPGIIEKLNALRSPKRRVIQSVAGLVVSAIVFAVIMHQSNNTLGASFLGWLVVVLFIHELGHYITMRACGYKNLQMLFIPMIGAAVIGRNPARESWKRALVSLMGPAPGIAIGTAMFCVEFVRGERALMPAAILFVVINLFNLLPIFPLDGGRILNELLFSRAPILEAVINVFGAVVLILVAVLTNDQYLLLFPLAIFAALPASLAVARLAKGWRQRLQSSDAPGPADLPAPVLSELVDATLSTSPLWKKAVMKKPAPKRNKAIAERVSLIWDRGASRPPNAPVTALLLLIYALVFIIPVIGIMGTGTAIGIARLLHPHPKFDFKENFTYTPIPDDGSGVVAIEHLASSFTTHDVGLDRDDLYHGTSTWKNPKTGHVSTQQHYDHGLLDGEDQIFDAAGEVHQVTLWDHGKVVKVRYRKKTGWVELSGEQASAAEMEDDEFQTINLTPVGKGGKRRHDLRKAPATQPGPPSID